MSACIFLVDDEPLQLLFLKGILSAAKYAVEDFERPAALLARVTASDRGCIILDLQMPEINGLELHKTLISRGISLPVIFVSGRADIPAAVAAMKQGAVDFITKPLDPAIVLAVVNRAVKTDARAVADMALLTQRLVCWQTLSVREQDVCRLCARGLMDKQIAATLHISASTVQAHRTHGMKKLQVQTTAELVQRLISIGESA